VAQRATFKISPEQIRIIADSLPEPVCERRRQLLPRILREWLCSDLSWYLSMESRSKQRGRLKKVEIVKRHARKLSQALDAVDALGRARLVHEMLDVEGRGIENISRAEWSNMRKWLDDEPEFLVKLARPRKSSLGPGQPRNISAYLVLQDAAEIFKWFTGTEATRQVDRSNSTETGPFFRFASVLWPIIFEKDTQGLPAAMKNWAHWRSRYDEQSRLIDNIGFRHPTWGVFDS
jgi:hypothetical protein